MKVLVVGGGGREHALVRRLSQDPGVDRVYAAPGNGGICAEAECDGISATDIEALARLAETRDVDLTVVGPEGPLVAGIADEFARRGLPVFGPTAGGARLEGSKSWAKDLCERHGIAAPRSRTFTDLDAALKHLGEVDPPYVVKADGLAAGKGVTVTLDRAVAAEALRQCLVERAFGEAGSRVVIEEFLEGLEISALALTDGHDLVPLALAQDHKRIGEGDTGPNTGGMGAYSPLDWVDEPTRRAIVEGVLTRTVRALEAEGIVYRGVVYAGLMLTDAGPKVLEFNCRFGDPETQAILPRLASNLGDALLACAEGRLGDYLAVWRPGSCVTVCVTSGGYPGDHRTGIQIDGLEAAAEVEGVVVFHSGTAVRDDRVVTAGGRVLSVTALGDTRVQARARAYEACSLLSFEGMYYRRDIAAKGGND